MSWLLDLQCVGDDQIVILRWNGVGMKEVFN